MCALKATLYLLYYTILILYYRIQYYDIEYNTILYYHYTIEYYTILTILYS